MKFNTLFLCVTLIGHIATAQPLKPISYDEAVRLLQNPTPEVAKSLKATPPIYSFANQDGQESVNYVGQTFRQVLLNDIKSIANTIEMGEFKNDPQEAYRILDSVYSYEWDRWQSTERVINGESDHRISVKDTNKPNLSVAEGATYMDIYQNTTNLRVKTAGVDNKTINNVLLGWNTPSINGVTIDKSGDGQISPEEFSDAIMQAVAVNAGATMDQIATNPGQPDQIIDNAVITLDGLDLGQLLQKYLHGALSFNQAVNDYLSVDLAPDKGLNADNERILEDRTFTVLQHHWDEAFGYYGAARDFANYTDQEIAGGYSKDTFNRGRYRKDKGDSAISLAEEKNFAAAVYAAKMDLQIKDGSEDFTTPVYDALIKGRQLINTKPAGYLKYVQAYAVVASVEWERLLAATTIHYVNKLLKEYGKRGTPNYSFQKLAVFFSEMKGFGLSFQFSTRSPMSQQDFLTLHQLFRDQPALKTQADIDTYKQELVKARDLIGRVYGFTQSAQESL